MTKIKDYREFISIEEGLITTYPMDFFSKKIKMVISKKDIKASIRIEKLTNSLVLNFRSTSIDFIKLLENIADQNGYFISLIVINNENVYVKIDDVNLVNESHIEIHFESKFDEEVKDIPDFLYHVTTVKNLRKIKKIGLVPKSKIKQTYHTDRIYLAFTIEGAKAIESEFKAIDSSVEYVILEISTEGLNIKFMKDPNSTLPSGKMLGIYTHENIPPKFIKYMDKLNEKLLEYKKEALNLENPMFREVYILSKQYPNDTDLGKHVRALVKMIEDYNQAEFEKKMSIQLEELTKKYKK